VGASSDSAMQPATPGGAPGGARAPGFWRAAAGLLCPRCGGSRVFAGWFRIRAGCPACGLVYEREPGYWIGAMYVNYGVTAVLLMTAWVTLDLVAGLPWSWVLAILVCLGAAFPVAFFRYSRVIWLALDVRLDPPRG